MKRIDLVCPDFSGKVTRSRIASRGVIIKDHKVLLSFETNNKIYQICGGGLEKNETIEECCIREVKEETGMIVKPLNNYLTIDEYFNDAKHTQHYFYCELIEETNERSLTKAEKECELQIVWMNLEEALKMYGSYDKHLETEISKYQLYKREFIALNELIKKYNLCNLYYYLSMNKVLLTAFEPFLDYKTNSSMEVLKCISNDNIKKVLLPVSYNRSKQLLISEINSFKPDIVLSLGLAGKAKEVRLERFAHNIQDSKSPDNDGIILTDNRISEGEYQLETNFNLNEIFNRISNQKIDIKISESAGTYVCNTVYYTSLITNFNNSLFVHLPNSKLEDDEGYDIDLLVEIVNKIIDYLLNLKV